MQTTKIRQVEGKEMLQIIQRLPGYALHASPPLGEEKVWQDILDEQVGTIYYALFEDNQPVACVARTPMIQHVRGVVMPMGGIFDVVTLPPARRKRYATRLMETLFSVMAEEGCPVTSLYPFRESFYENLGYASFSQPKWASFQPANLGRLLKMELDGEIELALLSECFDVYHDFLKRFQLQQPGMGLFTHRPLAPGKTRDSWIALAKRGSQVTGAMMYALRGDRPMHFDLRALRFYYLDHTSRYLLLNWIARHVDQARSAKILLAPSEEPEQWLVDSYVEVSGENFRGMGRVLKMTGLQGISCGPGRFSARIIDPFCPWNEGIWQLSENDGRLEIGPGQNADCTLKIQGFSALVYGTHDPQDFVFRGWGDPGPDLAEVMRSMFPAQQPYLHEIY
jgi:predicted acetyltransferase